MAVKEHMRRNGSKIQNTPVMLQLGRTVKGTRYSMDLARGGRTSNLGVGQRKLAA